MAYRILQVEGRVLLCQSKPNNNKRPQKYMYWLYKFCLCMQIFRVTFYEPVSDDFIMAIARFLFVRWRLAC